MIAVAMVLSGGKSRRFGSEKAMAQFEGEPLIARAVGRLAHQGLSVAVNAPPGSGAEAWARSRGQTCLADDAADPAGPLAGVKAGLLWARKMGAEALVTCPCDTPFLPVGLERSLIDALEPDKDAATIRTPSGLQSLCAAWRVGPALRALAPYFERGEHPPVHRFLESLLAEVLAFEDEALFANLNTPDDIAQVAGQNKPA